MHVALLAPPRAVWLAEDSVRHGLIALAHTSRDHFSSVKSVICGRSAWLHGHNYAK